MKIYPVLVLPQANCFELFWSQVAIAALLTLMSDLLGSIGFYRDGKVAQAEAAIAQIASIT